MDIKRFESEESEKNQTLIIRNKISKAKINYNPVYTDFLNPGEQAYVKQVCDNEGIFCDLFGGVGDCERKIAIIYKDKQPDISNYPVGVISIKGNSKFEKITFSDYLGAVMSLGLKREKIGDINIFDDCVQLWVIDDIINYVISNLSVIKHMRVECQVIDIKDAKSSQQLFKEMKINSPSMRLDAIVSSVINVSRSKSSEEIRSGSIKVNFVVCNNITYKIKKDDIISIRHYGRYVIYDMIGLTKSGNQKLLIKKYI